MCKGVTIDVLRLKLMTEYALTKVLDYRKESICHFDKMKRQREGEFPNYS